MEILLKYYILGFFTFYHQYFADVNSKVLVHYPLATLECQITNPKNTFASTILMCPEESMCFQNCHRICSPEICVSNNITCTSFIDEIVRRYVYVFNISNPLNQGEWRCHYGSEKGPPIMFPKDDMIPKIPPRNNLIKSTSVPTFIYPVTYAQKYQNSPVIVNPNYVILLLVIFSISLLINIVFLIRDMLTTISTRKAIISRNKKNFPGWLAICIKLFCLEKVVNIRKIRKTKNNLAEHNPLISRQVSSNVYEHPHTFHFQHPFLLENFAYAATPANERNLFINNFSRSKSFPVKNSEPNLYSPTPSSLNELINENDPTNEVNKSSNNELTNQIIYDNVAESSIQLFPYDSPLYFSSLARPGQRIGRHISMQRQNPVAAVSLSNLNLNCKYPSDSMIGNAIEPDENLLKDAINSRVELSKEMINQADNLLKRADSLLNKKETLKNS